MKVNSHYGISVEGRDKGVEAICTYARPCIYNYDNNRIENA